MKHFMFLEKLTAFKERPKKFRVIVLGLLCYHLLVLFFAFLQLISAL